MPTTRWLLLLALAWAVLAVAPGLTEPVKVAGVAGCAALLLWAPTGWRWSARHRILLLVPAATLLAGAVALEPAVALIGSLARAQGVVIVLALLALAAAASTLDLPERQRVYAAAAVLGAPVACYAIAQRLGLDPIAWTGAVPGRPAATLSNASTLAGWLALLLPITVHVALSGQPGRRLWLALAALQAAALLATGTRSALLALLIVAGAAWTLTGSRRIVHGVALAAAILALIAAAAIWRPASVQDRAHLWRAAAQALWEPPVVVDLSGTAETRAAWRPWLGYGPDQQQVVIAVARAHTSGERAEAQGLDADRAHQAVLDRALELGAIGLAAAALLIAAVLRALTRRWRTGTAGERGEAVALAIALGSWFLHLQTSFALTGDRTLAWIWIGFALAADASRPLPASADTGAGRAIGWSLVRAVGGALLMGAALAAAGLLPEVLLQRLAPALVADRDYLAGQQAYAYALTTEPAAATASLVAAAHYFERAALLRRYDCDAALAAASAWVEAAALTREATALASARRWNAACARMRPGDPRVAQVEARIATVAARMAP